MKTAETKRRAAQAAKQISEERGERHRVLRARGDLVVVVQDEEIRGGKTEPFVAVLYRTDKHTGSDGYIGRRMVELNRQDCLADDFTALATDLVDAVPIGDERGAQI